MQSLPRREACASGQKTVTRGEQSGGVSSPVQALYRVQTHQADNGAAPREDGQQEGKGGDTFLVAAAAVGRRKMGEGQRGRRQTARCS